MIFDCGCEFHRTEDGGWTWNDDEINFQCPKVWEMVCEGNTSGVFQLDAALGQIWSARVKPKNISEWSDLIAIIRPGTLEAIIDGKNQTQRYCDRKHGKEEVIYDHPKLEAILKPTQGIIVFQEQSMKIATELAGFSMSEADTYIRKCVSKDTIFSTMTGPKTIEELSKMKRLPSVKSVSKDGKNCWKKLSNVWCSGKKKLYEIKTVNGFRIKCTHDHRIFTNEGWKNASKLTEKDFICVANNLNYSGCSKNKTSPELAELYGYFLGEGCNSNGEVKITNSDDWILNRVREGIKKEFGDNQYREYIHKNGVRDIYLLDKAKIFFNKKFKKLKSRDKKTIKEIKTCNNSSRVAYIGALISGEGTVSVKDRTIVVTSTSKNLLEFLQHFLLSNGIHGGLSKKRGTYKGLKYTSWHLSICDPKEIRLLCNIYGKYICSEKLNKIKQIFPAAKSNSKFLVPNNFIKAVASVNNFNALSDGQLDISGSLYNKSLTYDRASLLNQHVFSELLDYVLDADYKFVRISSVQKAGKDYVYDFSIEDEDCSWAYGNGIIIHNSIGKKIPELIQKAKEMFVEGAKQHSNIDKELADRIFVGIEKSARYAFNLSHSISYGLAGYIYSAFIKAHFPLEFHCTELDFAKGKQPKTDLEAVCDIIEDALKMGIKVRKPDVRYLNEKFSIVDGEILYGLNKIKHLGSDKVKKLPSMKDFTYIQLIDGLSKVNKTSAENLIKSGACDFIKQPRTKMLADHRIYCKLNPEQKAVCLEKGGVLEGIKEIIKIGPSTKSKLCYNKVALKKLNELARLLENPIRKHIDTPQKIIDWEKETIGRSFTFDEALTRYWDASYKELTDVKHRNVPLKEPFLLSAVLRDYKEIYTKKKQEAMGRITIYSLDWVSDAVIFPKAWELCSNTIESNIGQTILFKARMNLYDGKWGLVIEDIEDV